MDIPNFIRSLIFLIPGLLFIFYSDKVEKFQIWAISKLRINYDLNKEKKFHKPLGIIFIIISIILLFYSIS